MTDAEIGNAVGTTMHLIPAEDYEETRGTKRCAAGPERVACPRSPVGAAARRSHTVGWPAGGPGC